MRFEYQNTENVKTKDIIIIEHCFTKKLLSCNKGIQGTDFGSEYELICSIYHPKGRISTIENEIQGIIGDSRKELSQTQWKIIDSCCIHSFDKK